MRLLVINPFGTNSWDESDKKLFACYASPGTAVDVVSLDNTRPFESLERREDYVDALPHIVQKAVSLQSGYDGMTVNCFLDPAVDDLKTLTERTVVGPCEASLALATTLGWWFGIVMPSSATRQTSTHWLCEALEGRFRALGYDRRVESMRSIDLHVEDLLAVDPQRTKSQLLEESGRAVDDGAEVIILGCTGLGGFAEYIQGELKVPVIDPVAATIKVLESLVKLKLRRNLGNRRR